MSEKVKQVLAELRRRFEAHYGRRLVKMILYGSHARGDAEPGADIDVLIVLDGAVDPSDEIARTIEDVAGLSLEHDEVLSCVFVSREQFESRQSPLLINVRREGVPA